MPVYTAYGPSCVPASSFILSQVGEVKTFREKRIFLFRHKQELNSWPPLPIDKGAFEWGKSRWQKSRRTHFALGLKSKKWILSEILQYFPSNEGANFGFFFLCPLGDVGEGRPPWNELCPRLKENFYALCSISKSLIFLEIRTSL